MSVRRAIAVADVNELNVSRFCADHGISRWSFYAIRRRYEAEGEAGLRLQSRAPKTVANKTPLRVENQIVRLRKQLADEGFDAGAETIRWHLIQQCNDSTKVPSPATVWRILKARGFIVDDPAKAPNKQWKRFAAERANELWQIDGTDYQLGNGEVIKIINIIDDGSRFHPASQAHCSESFQAAWETMCAGGKNIGLPERVLSDNGKGLCKLEGPLAQVGISMSHSRPFHPQTCGKVERFHQTQAKWLAARPPAQSISQLQPLLDEFRSYYNHQRPHRSIGRRTPATAWNEMAKTGPANQPLDPTIKTLISHTKVAANGAVAFGRSYRISIGAEHAGHQATTIVTGLNATIFINGQLIRRLTLDPTRRVQPIHPKPGRPRNPNQ